jgi:succinyl-diaminopimelate desuccinylase
VETKEIVALLQDLVRIPSMNPPGSSGDCARFLRDRFQQEGIDAEIVEGREGVANVVARLEGRRRGKRLVLNGHLDVVAPGEEWSVDPFGGAIQDGKLYGRGTCDMKSGVAAMACAMIDRKRRGADFDGEIVFMGVGDEETGSVCGTVYLLNENVVEGADFGIVSEPTSLRVELGNRGLRWIDIEVRGKASHAGRPYLGVNAIGYAAQIVEAIHSIRFDQRHDFFEIPTPSISVTMIRGGTKVNIIPERCDLAVDRRMIPGETGGQVLEELRSAIVPIVEQEKALDVRFKMRPVNWDAYVISEDEPIAKVMITAVEEITGTEPAVTGKAACTDASYLYHLKGIPTVIFGPGNEKLSHKPDECVKIDDLVTATRVYGAVFEKLL